MFDSSQVQCQSLAVVDVSPCLCQEVLTDNCKSWTDLGIWKEVNCRVQIAILCRSVT